VGQIRHFARDLTQTIDVSISEAVGVIDVSAIGGSGAKPPQKNSSSFKGQSPLKLLLLRPDAIGDMVLMIPLINTLKHHYPNADIHTLQQGYTAPLLAHHPAITSVLIDRKKSGEAKGIRGFLAYAKWLRSQRFDAVIMPYLEPYYARLMWAAGIPIRIGDGQKVLLRPWLTRPISLDYRNVMRHECEQMAKLAEGLDTQIPFVSTMDLYLSDDDREAATTLMTTLGIGSDFIIIHPASGGGNRPWSVTKYAAFITMILDKTTLQVVLTGAGKNEAKKVAEILAASAASADKTRVISTVNQTSLRTLMAMIDKAHVVIGTDTGPTHIAAALKRPVLCISPTKFVKSLRWGPWETRRQIVSASDACDLVCRPYKCPVTTCLDAIAIEQAFEALVSLMTVPPLPKPGSSRVSLPQAHETLDNKKSPSWEGLGVGSLMPSSLHIGILIRNDAEKLHYQAFYDFLKKSGFKVWIFHTPHSPLALLQRIWAHDLCVIHSQHKPLGWALLRQISALGMYVPPVWTPAIATDMDALTNLYQKTFKPTAESIP
jgi:heptosyltransferase III